MTAYGYTRVSRDSQAASGLGLAAQKRAITDYHQRALRGQARLGKIFVDAAVSAARHRFAARPAAASLLAAVERGDHVIVAKIDRAWRNLGDFAATLDAWGKQGVSVHLLDLGIDTSTPVGRLVASVMAAVAEWESRRIGERIRDAKEQMRARGLSANGKHVLGYRLLRSGRLMADPRQRQIFARIVRLRRGGKIFRDIAALLNGEGCRTYEGRRWNPQAAWRAYHAELELRGRRKKMRPAVDKRKKRN